VYIKRQISDSKQVMGLKHYLDSTYLNVHTLTLCNIVHIILYPSSLCCPSSCSLCSPPSLCFCRLLIHVITKAAASTVNACTTPTPQQQFLLESLNHEVLALLHQIPQNFWPEILPLCGVALVWITLPTIPDSTISTPNKMDAWPLTLITSFNSITFATIGRSATSTLGDMNSKSVASNR